MMTRELCAPLLTWFDGNKRALPWRRDQEPYHVWLSEIMLQQTRVEAVIPYYERFLRACPTVQALAALPEDSLLKLWEGLGYYSRARNLQKAARLVCDRFDGAFPQDFDALRALPGVGEYTAGAVGSISFGLAVPAVDGNVLRVTARLDNDSRPVTDLKIRREMTERVRRILPQDRAGDFNQALMELGATICLPNGAPKCGGCPVQYQCSAYEAGTALALPVRASKKARRIEGRTILMLRAGEMVGLRRRPKQGLLAGLWELPSYEGALSPEQTRQALADQGVQVRQLLTLRPAKHVFTHIEWHMTGYYVELERAADGFTWVTPDALRGAYALPSAFRSFLSVLEGA